MFFGWFSIKRRLLCSELLVFLRGGVGWPVVRYDRDRVFCMMFYMEIESDLLMFFDCFLGYFNGIF